MKKFFRILATPVTAPIKAVKNTARLLTIRGRATDVLDLAEEAEANPRLYRDAGWWSRVVNAVYRLADVLPIAPEARMNMQNVLLKAGIVLGAIGGLGGYLADQGILQLLPAKYAGLIGVVCGAAGTIAALLHPAPGKKPTDAPPPADQ